MKNILDMQGSISSDNSCRKAVSSFINNLWGKEAKQISSESSNISELYDFLDIAGELCRKELEKAGFYEKLQESSEINNNLWEIFHPEAFNIAGREKEAEKELKLKRKVIIEKLPENPVTNPAEEILFTSNILLTVPTLDMIREGIDLDPEILEKVEKISSLPQKYWYDHPIPVGIKKENNEVIYGLSNLDRAAAFEKKMGKCAKDAKISVLLSVSVTHPGLDEIALDYLKAELDKAGSFEHLAVYAFCEKDTGFLIKKMLAPLAVLKNLADSEEAAEKLLEVFGVDGEYGRHYSFLKAAAPLWQKLVNLKIKAVFKIDLDQVFPQDLLYAETGKTAFELLASPLWGAEGKDSSGRDIYLGMIAGALVNEKDIAKGLFTPDVDYPKNYNLKDEEKIFFSRLPQALSTRAEMMCRDECIQRIHVTGGTNGILVDALYRWKPFTPSFIGRAEDQAYILSSFMKDDVILSYLHQPGLIMRHDKEAFAADAIKAAASGKQIGDYIRIILFSAYASSLPGGIEKIKDIIDPFTGSFVSRLPVTLAVLRLLLRTEEMFASGKPKEAEGFLLSGVKRLKQTLLFTQKKGGKESALEKQLKFEEKGWDLYYSILNLLTDKDLSESPCKSAKEKIRESRIS